MDRVCAECVERPVVRWDFRDNVAVGLCAACYEPTVEEPPRAPARESRKEWIDLAVDTLRAEPGLSIPELMAKLGITARAERRKLTYAVVYYAEAGRLRAAGDRGARRYFVAEEEVACAL